VYNAHCGNTLNFLTTKDLKMKVLNSSAVLKTEVTTSYETPDCPKGLREFTYELEGFEGELVCHIEVEPAIEGAREIGTGLQLEPDYDTNIIVFAVYHRGVEFTATLSEEQLDEIANAFAEDWLQNDLSWDDAYCTDY
jgi:hypothetical protein